MINKSVQYFRQHKKLQAQLIFLLISVAYASVFLVSKDFNNHDMFFHYLRIKEIGEDLIHFHIPSFSIYTNEILGGATNYFYPYLLLIPIALLSTFLQGTHILAITLFIGIYSGLIITSKSLKIINKNYYFDILGSILYCASFPAFSIGYAQGDIGAFYALAVAPITFVGYYEWISNRKWKMMVIGITLLIYCNIASVLCILLVLIVLTILEIKQLDLKKIINLGKSIILTIMLSMAYWLPAIIIYLQNKIFLPSQIVEPSFSAKPMIITHISNYFIPQLCNSWGLIIFLGLLIYIFDWKNLTSFEHKMGIIGILILFINLRPVSIWLLSHTFLSSLQFLYRFVFINQFIFTIILAHYFVFQLSREISLKEYRVLKVLLSIWVIMVICTGIFMQIINYQIIKTKPYHPYLCKSLRSIHQQNDGIYAIFNNQLDNPKMLHGLSMGYIDYYPTTITVNKPYHIYFKSMPKFSEYTNTNKLRYYSKDNRYHQIPMTVYHGQSYKFKDNDNTVKSKIKGHMVYLKMHHGLNKIKILIPNMWYQYMGIGGSLIGLGYVFVTRKKYKIYD